MPKHVHAELMAEYAKDAMETNTPWKRWEFYHNARENWRPTAHHPQWGIHTKYRRKPKPKPSRERFEEWRREKICSGEDINMASPLWEAWKEAERQAANADDKHRKGCGEGGE